ncbi:MAG: cytochrome o ubiquinol oxidase subunit I, partial [Pseudomonadota bacterium]
FYVAFMPLYILGLMGVTRRLSQFEDTLYANYFIAAAVGVALIAIGLLAFIIQIVVSIRDREALAVDGDPWDGRTLEWATTSPPPHYNFAFSPRVYALDAWHHMKANNARPPQTGFLPIHMPYNTASGIVIAGFMTVMGFALAVLYGMWIGRKPVCGGFALLAFMWCQAS